MAGHDASQINSRLFNSGRSAPAFIDGRWSVSPLNFTPAVLAGTALPSRVELVDMTLSRGNQLPGVAFSADDQIAIARAVDEAGVPQMTPWVFGSATFGTARENYALLTGLGLQSKLCSIIGLTPDLTYQQEMDILLGAQVSYVEMSFRPYPGVLLSGLITTMIDVVAHARDAGVTVRVDCADAAWGELSFILDFCAAAHAAGADYIAIADHNGIGPLAIRHLMSRIKNQSPTAKVGVHMHNLAGLATASSLAAVEAGAEFVDVSVNGLGGTGGQADLAQLAASLEVYYGIPTGIDLGRLTELYQLVADRSGYPLHPLAPLVGEHAYAAMGIGNEEHDPYATNPILPSTVGNRVVDSPTVWTEPFAFGRKLQALGVDLPAADLQVLAERVRERIVTTKQPVTDEELVDLAGGLTPVAG